LLRIFLVLLYKYFYFIYLLWQCCSFRIHGFFVYNLDIYACLLCLCLLPHSLCYLGHHCVQWSLSYQRVYSFLKSYPILFLDLAWMVWFCASRFYTFLNSVFLQSYSAVGELSGGKAQQQQHQGQPFS